MTLYFISQRIKKVTIIETVLVNLVFNGRLNETFVIEPITAFKYLFKTLS